MIRFLTWNAGDCSLGSYLREQFFPLGAIQEHGTLSGNEIEISRIPVHLPSALHRLQLCELGGVLTKQCNNKSFFLYAIYREGDHTFVDAWLPNVSEAFPQIF